MASDNDDLPPFWYPFSLQFESTKREREFQTANEYLWHLQDTMGLGMAIFVAPIIVFELGYLLPLSFSLSFLFLSFGMAPLTIYIILRHRYVQDRLLKQSLCLLENSIKDYDSGCSFFQSWGSMYG